MTIGRVRAWVVGCLACGGILFALSQIVWLQVSAQDLTGTLSALEVVGSNAAPVVPALSIVALAGTCAAAIARRTVQVGAAIVVGVSGAAAAVSTLLVLADPEAAARASVAATTGVIGGHVTATVDSGPPLACMAALGLTVCAAGLAWAARSHHPPQSTRFAAPAITEAHVKRVDANTQGTREAQPAVEPERSRERGEIDPALAWDALSRGEDPSEHPPVAQ